MATSNAKSATNPWEIVRWWELRRIPYNLAVGVVGLVSLACMEIIGDKIVTRGEDFEEPIALLVGSLVFALLANAAYTLGWVVEWKVIKGSTQDHQAFRKKFFRLGFCLSCVLATLPMWIAALSWALYELKGR